MNTEIKILQRESNYTKDGKEKKATNFYLQVGNMLIPFEVSYIKIKSLGDKDPNYKSRIDLLKAVSEKLPSKEENIDK